MTGDLGHAPASSTRPHTRLVGSVRTADSSAVAEEVPVAFVYSGKPHVVMMCTPTDLEDLAVGFSISEEIVRRADDVSRIDVVKHAKGIELQVEIPPANVDKLAQRTRALAGRTGCGLCGVEAIDDAVRSVQPVTTRATFPLASLWRASGDLDVEQPVNRETHALHAAGWARGDGALEFVREDVGRHNALDKVIGAVARAHRNAAEGFVVVTSRASYELVQKAAVVGIPLLAAVSRPTGLAIRFAEDAGITLVGLLRGQTANVYTHPERIPE